MYQIPTDKKIRELLKLAKRNFLLYPTPYGEVTCTIPLDNLVLEGNITKGTVTIQHEGARKEYKFVDEIFLEKV